MSTDFLHNETPFPAPTNPSGAFVEKTDHEATKAALHSACADAARMQTKILEAIPFLDANLNRLRAINSPTALDLTNLIADLRDAAMTPRKDGAK